MNLTRSHLLLDACCILNLCASGWWLEILRTIPAQVAVSQVVREQELKTLQNCADQNNLGATIFEESITHGLLMVVDFESEVESELFVNYVYAIRDDGESATGAIAVHRGWAMATDDRRAISFFQQQQVNMEIVSTLDLIKHWSEVDNIEFAKLKIALQNIKIKGRYQPHKSHPLRPWWEKVNP